MKDLDRESWLNPDPTWEAWRRFRAGHSADITPEIWLESVVSIDLREEADPDIRELFHVARAAIAYGIFYYPLLTLGTEQLWRILERITRATAERLTGRSTRSFAAAVDTLHSIGAISAREHGRLKGSVGLRNYTSHPTGQLILGPNDALDKLADIVRRESAFAALSVGTEEISAARVAAVSEMSAVKDDIYELVYARRWWDRLLRLIRVNQALPDEDAFYGLLEAWYVAFMATGVRRQTDMDDRSVSLLRLLNRFVRMPELALTEDELRAMYAEDLRESASADHATRLPAQWAARHAERIKEGAKPIRLYVNTQVAHKSIVPSQATHRELATALDSIIEAVLDIEFALTGKSSTKQRLEGAVEQFDWARALRTPWVTSEVWATVRDS